jgi:DNA-binding transcriptional LysR family regulator
MDLAVRIGKLPNSDLVARKLADCRLMACASPVYLAAAGTPATPADLGTHALIGYMGDVTTAQWTFVDSDGQATGVRCRCRFLANNTGMMTEVALCGFGIVYGPTFVFAKHLEAGDLVPVLPAYSNPVLPLHAVTPAAKHVNVKTRLFIERLQLAFGSPAPWDRWLDDR